MLVEFPVSTKERLESARAEWKGNFLGTLIGYRHRQASNQITGHFVDTFFSESKREDVIQV